MDRTDGLFGATKSACNLLVLFVPSRDRFQQAIDQEFWVNEALAMLGTLFGGATAFPRGKGILRDDARGGTLVHDEPVVIQCYTSEALIEQQAERLQSFLLKMGTESSQGAVGLVIDQDYLEIGFPVKEEG